MFDPIDFLNFSKSLLFCDIIHKNEAMYRSIISRSYYSAFLTTREKIDKIQPGLLTHGKKESHKDIIDNILNIKTSKLTSKQKIRLHESLQELEIYRINADYKFPNAIHPKEQGFRYSKDPTSYKWARYVVGSAERIISTISSL